jgi:hypothetical protein
MIEAIAKLGLSGSVGALLGIVAVWWVEPTTGQGAALLIAISVIFSTAIGGLISYFVRSKEIRAGSDEPGARPPEPRQPPEATASSEELNSAGGGI